MMQAHPKAGTIPAMSAREIRDRIAKGELTAMEVANALLARIAELEPKIRAWAWLDPDYVRAQAASLDAWQKARKPLGPLHGVPVGVKDILHTRGIPTRYGCAVTDDNVPGEDAAAVEALWASGALVMGKTVTTELAFMTPGPTRNPLNPDHTPGGSSSGSAAAVASGMVPLAIGSQTGGSVIRPASYCGVVGIKPSFGVISRRGVLAQSPSLDTLGVFARTLGDAALLVDILSGEDPLDPATKDQKPTHLLESLKTTSDTRMKLALVKLPGVAEQHYEELKASLKLMKTGTIEIVERDLPSTFDSIAAWRECLNFVEMARNYQWLEARGRDRISEKTLTAIDKGKASLATEYLAAREAIGKMQAEYSAWSHGFDATLSTSTAGRAPGWETTGTAICNGLWTFLGAPSVTIPLPGSNIEGLPLGIQITAPLGKDRKTLQAAASLSLVL